MFCGTIGAEPQSLAYVEVGLPPKKGSHGSTDDMPPKRVKSGGTEVEEPPPASIRKDPIDPFPNELGRGSTDGVGSPKLTPKPLAPEPWPDQRGKAEIIDCQMSRGRKGSQRPPICTLCLAPPS